MPIGEIVPIPTARAGGCGGSPSPAEVSFTTRPTVPSARTSPGPAWPADPGSCPSHYFTWEKSEAEGGT